MCLGVDAQIVVTRHRASRFKRHRANKGRGCAIDRINLEDQPETTIHRVWTAAGIGLYATGAS